MHAFHKAIDRCEPKCVTDMFDLLVRKPLSDVLLGVGVRLWLAAIQDRWMNEMNPESKLVRYITPCLRLATVFKWSRKETPDS